MASKIFVNLPVQDLEKSMALFREIGFDFNPQFTDDTAACMVISEHIYAMLLTHAKFKEFTKKAIADARTTTEVLTALTVEGREEVDAMVGRALDAGGSPAREPQDHGFMYERSFEDLDGHIWEIVWMDPKAIQDQ
jgi:predicted lactoylglutathione lyase